MSQLEIKKILCAVDFSEESKKAMDFAYALSSQIEGCELVVISVVRPIPTPMGDFTGASDSILDDNLDDLKIVSERLKKYVTETKGDCPSKITDKAILGNPVEEILKQIEMEKPDIVVMGNRKHGFKRGILTGSVSERVSANSPVSVLIVR
ncbi:MAG: universal stress protein [Cuniculiplasma sp.]